MFFGALNSWLEEQEKQKLYNGDITSIVPQIIAKNVAQLYCGGGTTFFSKDKKIMDKWEEFKQLNNFNDFVYLAQKQKSLTGVSIITLSKTKQGNVILNFIDPFVGPNQVAYVYNSPQLVVLAETIMIDTTKVICKTAYDTEKVVRTFWTQNEIGEIKLYQYSSKVNEKLMIELGTYNKESGSWIFKHGLGFIPVEIMTNLPFKAFQPIANFGFYFDSPVFGNGIGVNFNETNDCAHCKKEINLLQEIIENKFKAIKASEPRILVGVSSLAAQNKLAAEKQKKMLNQKSNGIEYIIDSPNNKVSFNVIPASATIDQLNAAAFDCWKNIYKIVGLTYNEQNSTQKTEQESFNTFQGNIEKLKFLQNYSTPSWKSLIVKVFKILGIKLKDNDYYFTVNSDLAVDLKALIDNDIKLLQIGVKTPKDILCDTANVAPYEADNKIKENKEWFKENQDLMDKSLGYQVSGVDTKASLPSSNNKQEESKKVDNAK